MKNPTEFRQLPTDFNPQQYNQAVAHPFQSWQYGEVLSKLGRPVLRFGQFRQKQLVQGFQFTLHKIPFTDYYLAFLARGALPSEKQLRLMKPILQKAQVAFVRLEPYVKDNSKIKASPLLVRSPDSLTFNYTIQIDLTKPEPKLLSSLKPKTRYNLKIAVRNGVQVREQTNLAGHRIFLKLLMETCERKGFYAKSLRYHQALFTELKQKQAHILIAYHNQTPLGAYELLIFKDKAHFVFGGSSYQHRQFMGTNLLMWQTLLFAKAQGCRILDMSETLGSDYSMDHPWAGLTRFAEGYHGRFIKFLPNYDFIINSKQYDKYQGLIGKVMHSFTHFLARDAKNKPSNSSKTREDLW